MEDTELLSKLKRLCPYNEVIYEYDKVTFNLTIKSSLTTPYSFKYHSHLYLSNIPIDISIKTITNKSTFFDIIVVLDSEPDSSTPICGGNCGGLYIRNIIPTVDIIEQMIQHIPNIEIVEMDEHLCNLDKFLLLTRKQQINYVGYRGRDIGYDRVIGYLNEYLELDKPYNHITRFVDHMCELGFEKYV